MLRRSNRRSNGGGDEDNKEEDATLGMTGEAAAGGAIDKI
jgi:hypothetical protein